MVDKAASGETVMWQLDNALNIVRILQPASRKFGYHLTLGGGVLNKGQSDKDLDLYFLPMGGFDDSKKSDPDGMLRYLTRLWGTPSALAESLVDKARYGKATESFYKHAVQFNRWGGTDGQVRQRIDCFIF
jgi:hypothetical protein